MPGAALGVFLARVLGEQVGVPGVWAAVLGSLLFGATAAWLLGHRPLADTWPALLLIVYILYPEPDTLLAAQIAAVSLVALRLSRQPSQARAWSSTRVPPLLPPVLAGLAVFVLYGATLAPDVLAADSGELQVIAAQLGVAHPPGFPLYVMIGHLFVRLLPFVTPAYTVNLFSAVTAAMAVGVVYHCVKVLSGRHLPAFIAAMALATATTYWSQATTANVRSLTGLFAALIILTLIYFRKATVRGDSLTADRWLTLTAVAMSFGLTHHISLVFLVLIGLLYILLADRTLIRTPRRWWRPAIAALAGLLPLLYLPLRSSADVRGASADLATWPGFIEHALATGFRGDLFYYLAPAELGQRLLIMGNVLTFQFAPFLLAGIVLGLILVIRRDRLTAFLLVGSFVAYVLVAATYRAPQTVEYMIPGYVAASVLLGYAVGRLPTTLRRFGWWGAVASTVFTALMLVAAVGQLPSHISASGANHEATAARDYAATLLDNAPKDSVILTHWHWATPLWYLREIEGVRPDVDVRFVYPTGEPYEETWQRRVREAFAEGRSVIATWVPPSGLDGLPAAEPLGEAILFSQAERTGLPLGFTPIDLTIGDSVKVVGYQLDLPAAGFSTGEEAAVTIAWSEGPAPEEVTGLYLHLVGPDGIIVAQDDQPVLTADDLALTRFRVTPRPGAPTGSLTILLGAAGSSAERQPLTTLELRPARSAPFTGNRVQRILVNGDDRTLVGYDWDHTLPGRRRLYLHWRSGDGFQTQVVDDAAVDDLNLPAYRGPWGVPVESWRFSHGRDDGHYVPLGEGIVWTGEMLNGATLQPGESFVLSQRLHSARTINRDYVVSVRLIGLEPDGIHWAWWDLQDSIPAMGAIPTLKWVEESFVRSPHRMTVDQTAGSGQVLTGALILYDAFTNRPLPVLDDRLTAENPRIPLGRSVVR